MDAFVKPLLKVVGVDEATATPEAIAAARTLVLLGLVVVALLVTVGASFALTGSSSGSRKKRQNILLLGLNNSGKTTLFGLLKHGKILETRSSMEENVATFTLNESIASILPQSLQAKTSKKPITLVDLPGHDKLRYKLTSHLPTARKIIVVVDAATVQAQNQSHRVRAIAELLTDTLVERSVARDAVPVLIVCNKQDDLLAANAKTVKGLVEAEMNRLRSTRSAVVDSQDDSKGDTDEFLGVEGEAFTFDQVPNPVEFVEVSLTEVAGLLSDESGGNDDENGGFKDALIQLCSFVIS